MRSSIKFGACHQKSPNKNYFALQKFQYQKGIGFLSMLLIVTICFPRNVVAVSKFNGDFFVIKTAEYGKIACYQEEGIYKSGKPKGKKDLKPLSSDLKNLETKLKKAKKQKKIDSIQRDIDKLKQKMSAQSELCRKAKEGDSNPANPLPTPTPRPTPEPDNSLDQNSLLPIERQLQRADVHLLLEKGGFGLSPREEYLVNIGVNQGVDALVEEFMRQKDEDPGLISKVEDLTDTRIGEVTTPSPFGQRMALMELWTHTNNPYAEKLAIFLLSVWTVSGDVIEDETFRYLWWDYFKRLRIYASNDTNLVNLGVEITRDPLMLIFLNNELNKKGKPNENYARELMELFTVGPTNLDGQPNYSETRLDGTGDIPTAAKALTGWRVRKSWDPVEVSVRFDSVWHDNSDHIMFPGTSYSFNAANDEDLVRGIFSKHPNVAYYYAKEILQEYLTPNPPRTLIENLAIVIKENNFNLRAVFKTLFKSKAFFHSKFKNTLPKNSIEFAVGAIKSLKLENAYYDNEVTRKLSYMGMEITNPPSVFWFNPSSWTGPSVLLERANFIALLLGSTSAHAYISPAWTPSSVLASGNISAEQVVDSLATYLGLEQINTDSKLQLLNFMNKVKQWNGTYQSVAYNNTNLTHQKNKGGGLLYVLTSMSDYQLK